MSVLGFLYLIVAPMRVKFGMEEEGPLHATFHPSRCNVSPLRLLTTQGFRGRPIQRRHFWLQGSKGRCHGNQILAKMGKDLTKI